MGYYTIKKGDTLSGIARAHGCGNWQTIYNHPQNAEFRRQRPDPNLIYPGDRVFIPESGECTKAALADGKKDADDNFDKDGDAGDLNLPCKDPPPACAVQIEDACRLVAKGKKKKFKANGAPAGGTYQWTVTGNASIVGAANNQIVEVQGNSPSAAAEDIELKVVYTVAKTCEATLKLTVYELTKIRATVKSTPRLTARAGFAEPNDFRAESTEVAKTMDLAKTLVLMRGDLQDLAFQADVTPADTPIGWDIERADDDAAALGNGLPTVTKDAADNKKATLKTDERGSFHLRAFADCNRDNKCGPDEAFIRFPIVLVEAILQADNSVTHTAHIAPTVGGGQVRLRTGSFNIGAPATEAIHMNCTVDLVSGGADGRRHLDAVFAGWVNNERANENIRGTYTNGHTRFSIFASNNGQATGAGQTFLPTDPAPVPVAPPVLDSGMVGAGSGGDTAALTRSRVRSRTDQALGSRWIVESIDSPGDGAPLVHPAFVGERLTRYHFELHFSALLCFWTNRSKASGATGDPADRVYACVRSFNWDMLGEWTVDLAGAITTVTAMAVTISNATTHQPAAEADDVNCEVRPPTGLSLLANDGRT